MSEQYTSNHQQGQAAPKSKDTLETPPLVIEQTNPTVRILSVALHNVKNVKYGLLEMPSLLTHTPFSEQTDILGIYGQNGSGKTAVIDALELIRELLTGRAVSPRSAALFSSDETSGRVTIQFAVGTLGERLLADYSVCFTKSPTDGFCITRETLGAKEDQPGARRRICIDYNLHNEDHPILPVKLARTLAADASNFLELKVAARMAQKENRSFLFGDDVLAVFSKMKTRNGDKPTGLLPILSALKQYAQNALFVVSNTHTQSGGRAFYIPGLPHSADEPGLRLSGPATVSPGLFDAAVKIIENMNTVLSTIIPGLTIRLHDLGTELMPGGQTGRRGELESVRGGIVTPVKYESEGILRIISILNVLINLFSQASMCLVIDEFDSGIYEYLLGELLLVLGESAKGQLIFTSHNLRPLEMLDLSSVVFTTTNPEDRYLRLKHVKHSSNLRDVYLRSITLGGQDESIYDETDKIKMGRAFRRAGSVLRHE